MLDPCLKPFLGGEACRVRCIRQVFVYRVHKLCIGFAIVWCTWRQKVACGGVCSSSISCRAVFIFLEHKYQTFSVSAALGLRLFVTGKVWVATLRLTPRVLSNSLCVICSGR